MFVKVYTDVGKKCPVIMTARVIRQESSNYHIKYLSPTGDKYNGKQIYRFEDSVYEIDDDSITEFMDSSDGFIPIEDGFIKDESDSDYYPTSESDSESESVSYDESENEYEDDECDWGEENYDD